MVFWSFSFLVGVAWTASDSLSAPLLLSLSFVLHLALLFFFFLLDCCYVKLGRVQTTINTIKKKKSSLPIHFSDTIALAQQGSVTEDYDKEWRIVWQQVLFCFALFCFFSLAQVFVMSSRTALHWLDVCRQPLISLCRVCVWYPPCLPLAYHSLLSKDYAGESTGLLSSTNKCFVA